MKRIPVSGGNPAAATVIIGLQIASLALDVAKKAIDAYKNTKK